TRGTLSVGSLLNGSNPIQDSPVTLQEFRIGKPLLLCGRLCDVVIVRLSNNAARPSRWTMTLLIDLEQRLLRQVITTGTCWDGRERLQIETYHEIELDRSLSGNLFRLPKIAVRDIESEAAEAAAAEEKAE